MTLVDESTKVCTNVKNGKLTLTFLSGPDPTYVSIIDFETE